MDVRAYPNSNILLHSVESKPTCLLFCLILIEKQLTFLHLPLSSILKCKLLQLYMHPLSLTHTNAVCQQLEPAVGNSPLQNTGHGVQGRVGQKVHISFRQPFPPNRRHHLLAFLSWIGHPALEDITRAPQGCLSPFHYEQQQQKDDG